MVVMVIIAIIMGITLPRFQAAIGSRIKSDVRSIVGTIEFAFFLSASQKKPIRVNFDISSGKYWLSSLEITDPLKNIGEFLDIESSKREISSDVRFLDIFVAHSGKVESGVVFMLCTPQGYCEPIIIHLRDDSKHDFTLRLKPLTGEVAVYKGYRDFVEFSPAMQSW